MNCATAGGFVRMASGATSLLWRMLLRAASIWPTSRSCATATTQPLSTCSICACSWTVKIPFSAFPTRSLRRGSGYRQDHNPDAARPFGDRPVWGGFDPARSGDLSCFVIVAPPMFAVEKFRVLKVIYWKGMNFRYQQSRSSSCLKIQLHLSGRGRYRYWPGVFDNIQHFAMRVAVAIRYDLNTKISWY